MRLLACALLVVLLAGCMGPGRGTVDLPPISQYSDHARPKDTVSPIQSGSPPPVNDCATTTVNAGASLVSRIRCTEGTGHVEVPLDGCAPGGELSWLSIDTPEGMYGAGNATATVATGAGTLASLKVAASQDEGKETTLENQSGYTLSMDLESWQGQWVLASLECPAP